MVEGNQCYKFSTLRRFIERTGAPPVHTILDVGANVGSVTLMMAGYFPEAAIHAFEPVEEYFNLGKHNTKHLAQVHWLNGALSMQHRYADDLGLQPRAQAVELRLLKALPEGGPGWGGGSLVVAQDDPAASERLKGYALSAQKVQAYELERFLAERGIERIDLIKLDCEGCEHHVLGCASASLLSRIRFITGEYHGIERFYSVMRSKLFLTHKVNLIGGRQLGCFFAERLQGDADGILRFEKAGMLQHRAWLGATPLDWHLFAEEHVSADERWFHALSQ